MKDKSPSIISQNVKHLRKLLGHTQATFADEIGASRAQIGSYEEGRATPPINVLIEIQKLCSLSLDQLIQKDLSFLTKEDLRQTSESIKQSPEKTIPMIPQKAAAGYMQGFADPEYLDQLPQIHFPMLRQGDHLAFEIDGDSMLPLPSGTIIIAQKVEKITDIKDGHTYIVASSEEGLVYKRVYLKAQIGQSPLLHLVSDNPSYAPFDLAISDIQQLWKAVMFVSQEFPSPQNMN
ncbi:MAG: LexA family transcriptional regulator [Bacteroidia bacterium]|nr:LexA family transcriptional regulator [Bacteroidia bacterium]